jgi:MerR HTH family regulatory protein
VRKWTDIFARIPHGNRYLSPTLTLYMPTKWVRISEYARRWGVAASTLRRWETEGVTLPVRRSTSDQRVYDVTLPPARARYARIPVHFDQVCTPTRTPGIRRGIVVDRETIAVLGRCGYGVSDLLRGTVPDSILALLP